MYVIFTNERQPKTGTSVVHSVNLCSPWLYPLLKEGLSYHHLVSASVSSMRGGNNSPLTDGCESKTVHVTNT